MKKLSSIKAKIEKKPALKYSLKVLWWVILLLIGFVARDYYDSYTAKPSLDLVIPETYNNQGIFEFTFVNGEVELKDVVIKIQSPNMNKTWQPFYPDDFPKNYQYNLDFTDKKTLETAQKINCTINPFNNLDYGRAKLKLYKNKTSGKFIMPSQNATFYACGYDKWEIIFYSDKLNKSFTKQMYMPLSYKLEGIGEDKDVDINSPDIVEVSDVIFSMYDQRAIEFSEEMSK